jgi:hypothetical protein
MNFRQKQLAEELFEKTKKRYPEISFLNITNSPEDPNDLWVNVFAPMSEDKEIKMGEYSAKLTTKILMKYGYLILLMSRNPKLKKPKKLVKKEE